MPLPRLLLFAAAGLAAAVALVLVWTTFRGTPPDVASLPAAAVASCGADSAAEPFGLVECAGEAGAEIATIAFDARNRRGGWRFPGEAGRRLRGDYFNLVVELACEGCTGPAAILATDLADWTSKWQPLELSEEFSRIALGFEIPDSTPAALEQGLWVSFAPPSPDVRILVRRIVVFPAQ